MRQGGFGAAGSHLAITEGLRMKAGHRGEESPFESLENLGLDDAT